MSERPKCMCFTDEWRGKTGIDERVNAVGQTTAKAFAAIVDHVNICEEAVPYCGGIALLELAVTVELNCQEIEVDGEDEIVIDYPVTLNAAMARLDAMVAVARERGQEYLAQCQLKDRGGKLNS